MAGDDNPSDSGLGVRFTKKTMLKAMGRRRNIKKLLRRIEDLTCTLVNEHGDFNTADHIMHTIRYTHREHHHAAIRLFGADATEESIQRDLDALHGSLDADDEP